MGHLPTLAVVGLAIAFVSAACLSTPGLPAGVDVAHASSKPAPPCQTAFPDARSKTIGKTTWYNRQEGVRMVLCNRFGLEPSADFPISAGMVCNVLSQVIGGYSRNLGLFIDGSCSGADIASSPKEPVKYISVVCGWASDLLEIARPQIGKLAAIGCATAPSIGTGLGAALESKHEFDVAVDVISHNMCIKYSPTHFGSPWVTEACASGDKGFQTLPVYHPGGPTTTAPVSGGGGGTVTTGGGPAPGGGGSTPAGSASVGQVTPLGPTAGPSGFGMAVATSPCKEGLTTFAGGSKFHMDYDGQQVSETGLVMTDNLIDDYLAVGRYQLTFACTNVEESVTEWTAPGFEIEVTEPPRQVILASTAVSQGENLAYESGASNGLSPCPAIQGYEPFGVFLGLERPGTMAHPEGIFESQTFVQLPDNASSEELPIPADAGSGQVVVREECDYQPAGPAPTGAYAEFNFEPVFLNLP